jgi:hypothetical protein
MKQAIKKIAAAGRKLVAKTKKTVTQDIRVIKWEMKRGKRARRRMIKKAVRRSIRNFSLD